MDRLQDKVAIITGTSSGVGRAAMQVFAREGAKVVGVARRKDKLDETLDLVKQQGGEGLVVPGDLSHDEVAKQVVDATLREYGQIDILVNNAGVGYSYKEQRPDSMNDLMTTTPEDWQDVMNINLNSLYYMCRHVIPYMRERRTGSIINVASISGFLGLPAAHTYTAAKGATINLTHSLAVTYAADGLRVNCVAPGYIDTPMIAAVMGIFDDPTTAAAASPMARAATPDEIAYACLFFASDESTYCNGAMLAVDGGTSVAQR